MQMIITCPNCGKASVMPAAKLPSGRLKTTCNQCHQQFTVDKDALINCEPKQQFEQEGWEVDHPACAGMKYDQDGIEGLIRSGMIDRFTKVKPPGAKATEADRIMQLRKAFELFDKMNPSR